MRIIELKHYSRKQGRSRRNHYTKKTKTVLRVLTFLYIAANAAALFLVLPYMLLNFTH